MKKSIMYAVAAAVAVGGLTLPAAASGRSPSNSGAAAAQSASEISTTTGQITALNLNNSSARNIQIKTADNKIESINLDATSSSIWGQDANGETKLIQPNQLQIGQTVRVRHMNRNGQQLARSVEVLGARQAGVAASAAPIGGAAGSESMSGAPSAGAMSVPHPSAAPVAPSSNPNAGSLSGSAGTSSTIGSSSESNTY